MENMNWLKIKFLKGFLLLCIHDFVSVVVFFKVWEWKKANPITILFNLFSSMNKWWVGGHLLWIAISQLKYSYEFI